MAETEINLEAIEAELSKLSKEDLFKQLVGLKTKQRVAQKKYYNPDNAKKYRLQKAKRDALMVERAKQLGIYDEIVAAAAAAADEQLADAEAGEAA